MFYSIFLMPIIHFQSQIRVESMVPCTGIVIDPSHLQASAHTPTHSHTHTYKHTHTQTHTPTHIHSHTHTHTHSQTHNITIFICPPSRFCLETWTNTLRLCFTRFHSKRLLRITLSSRDAHTIVTISGQCAKQFIT